MFGRNPFEGFKNLPMRYNASEKEFEKLLKPFEWTGITKQNEFLTRNLSEKSPILAMSKENSMMSHDEIFNKLKKTQSNSSSYS